MSCRLKSVNEWCASNFKSIVYIDAETMAIEHGGKRKQMLSGSIFRVRNMTQSLSTFSFLSCFGMINIVVSKSEYVLCMCNVKCVWINTPTWSRRLIRQTADHYANLKWNGKEWNRFLESIDICDYQTVSVCDETLSWLRNWDINTQDSWIFTTKDHAVRIGSVLEGKEMFEQ